MPSDVATSHPPATSAERVPPPGRYFLPTLLAAFLALTWLLGAVRPLSVPDEGRYAEISRWMLVSGDWLIPRIDGLPFFHKPPLTHWLQAASMAVLGVSPWAVRLPGVLLAGLMVAGAYVAVRRLADETLARRAALMLAASGALLVSGTYVNHDMGVATWIATTIWCFALAFSGDERPHAGWARAGFAASALGVLTKGLIGLALPGLVLFIWITWTRRWRQVPRLPWISGVLLFALIAGPWFVWVGQRYPGMWGYLFGVQQFSRYAGTGFNNPQPWWFYLAAASLLLFPWSLWVWQRLWTRLRHRAPAAVEPYSSVQVLCWIWLAAILLFFSVPRSKLVGYILPVMPPLAVLAAVQWQRSMAARRHAGRWFAALAALPVASVIALSVVMALGVRGASSSDVAAALACRATPGDPVFVAGGYPFDLPFLAQTVQPIVAVADWPRLRKEAGDNWQREFFEAGDFEPATASRVLRTLDALPPAAQQPRRWLLVRRGAEPREVPDLTAWTAIAQGKTWDLYRSAAEGPESTEQEGLAGCHDHRRDQRRP